MSTIYRISLLLMSFMLIAAQLAPIGMQWMDMEVIECISMDETEKEEKKKKEVEEKEKYASNGVSFNSMSSSIHGQYSSFSFRLPHPPCMETLSPPPDMFH